MLAAGSNPAFPLPGICRETYRSRCHAAHREALKGGFGERGKTLKHAAFALGGADPATTRRWVRAPPSLSPCTGEYSESKNFAEGYKESVSGTQEKESEIEQ